MDAPYPAPLPARWGALMGVLGSALAGASAALPWPEATTPVAWAGFILAGLGGLAGQPPAFAEGKPLVQGVWLTVCSTGLLAFQQFQGQVPAGWPQSLALFGAGLLAWAGGMPLPHLGATANLPPSPQPAPVPPELRGLGVTLDPAPTPPGGAS